MPTQRTQLEPAVIDQLAHELIDPKVHEFSIAIGYWDFWAVEVRADEIEGEMLDAA